MIDGKTIIAEGGEYNFGSAVWTNLGSIGTVTPFGGVSWAPNNPPAGWNSPGRSDVSLKILIGVAGP